MHGAVRRVVTGHDAEGRAVFVSDEAIAPIVPTLLPDNAFHRLWGGDAAPHFPDLDEKLPGLARHMEPADPGMHTTATIDFEVVLSGSCVLELDDGATVELNAGDTVVQNGTRHRWSNRSGDPCLLAVFICGAHHEVVHPPSSQNDQSRLPPGR